MPRYWFDPEAIDKDGSKGAMVPWDPSRAETPHGHHVSEGETYRDMHTYELVTVEPSEVRQLENGATVQIGGRQELRAVDLSSRRRHREYMAREGLSMPSDWTNHLEAKRKERADILNTSEKVDHGSQHFRAIREQVGRIVYEKEVAARKRRK